MKSLFNGSGYYLNDDRASGGKLVEDDMLGCKHCQAGIKKSTWVMNAGYARCPGCDGFLCDSCYDKAKVEGCQVFEKIVDRRLTDLYRRQQNEKVLGI